MKYCQHPQLNKQVISIMSGLAAIADKESQHLDMTQLYQQGVIDRETPFDEAVQKAMQIKAKELILSTKAVVLSFDRVLIITQKVIDQLENREIAEQMKERLNILLNFSRIEDDLRPEMNHKFAQK